MFLSGGFRRWFFSDRFRRWPITARHRFRIKILLRLRRHFGIRFRSCGRRFGPGHCCQFGLFLPFANHHPQHKHKNAKDQPGEKNKNQLFVVQLDLVITLFLIITHLERASSCLLSILHAFLEKSSTGSSRRSGISYSWFRRIFPSRL